MSDEQERAHALRSAAEKWHDEETLGDASCDYRELEIHAYIAGYVAASAGRAELLEALRVVCSQFPTDFDMAAAGWNPEEIEEACTAYDFARAAIRKATESQPKEQ